MHAKCIQKTMDFEVFLDFSRNLIFFIFLVFECIWFLSAFELILIGYPRVMGYQNERTRLQRKRGKFLGFFGSKN